MLTPEDKNLFADATKDVKPVGGKGRSVTPPSLPLPRAPRPIPEKSPYELLEDNAKFAFLHSGEYFEGSVLDLDPCILSRLRAGTYSQEGHIDLHGMNARQAYDALLRFIRQAYVKNQRCVTVITGRGRNSPEGLGVLRPMLRQWLCRVPFKRVVLAFCTAQAKDGGAGAVYVLLRKFKKSRGRIIWERLPPGEDFPDC
ncbi:MAG: Smr/MutS family protein [Desulfovibrio sp.]|jgi:DNA-nicking Smr family endonuclease|nr:Smr/MutS family protein [Desulfovibrio sp.]